MVRVVGSVVEVDNGERAWRGCELCGLRGEGGVMVVHITLAVLLEEDGYSVQSLEYDIASQGKTVVEAIRDFANTLEAEISLGSIWDAGQAPPCYWDAVHDVMAKRGAR